MLLVAWVKLVQEMLNSSSERQTDSVYCSTPVIPSVKRQQQADQEFKVTEHSGPWLYFQHLGGRGRSLSVS